METFRITIRVTMSDEALDAISNRLITNKRLGTTWQERHQSISEMAARNLAAKFVETASQYTDMGSVWADIQGIAHEAYNGNVEETTC